MSWYSRCSRCGGPFNGRNCRQCTNVWRSVRRWCTLSTILETGVDIILKKDCVCFALQEMKIYPLMLLIRTFSMILQTFSPTLHNPSTSHTRVSYVGTILNMVMIVHHGYRLSMSKNLATIKSLRRFNFIYDDDDDYEESTIPLNEIDSQIPPSIAITPVLLIEDPEDSLTTEDKDLHTIPKKEADEFIKSSVEDLVPIPTKSKDTSDSKCDLPFCDNCVTLSNPLFDSNDDFTSSDDETLSDEDVQDENVKIYSNPLFEFNDEYIYSNVNPLFDELLGDIKDSYVSNLDEPDLLVTPLFNSNEDECFNPGDDIELLLHRDLSTPKMSVASILEGFTNEPPLGENDDLFDLESKKNKWKKILYDALVDDLMTEDKVFDPRIHEKKFSPTYVRLPFKDRHYLFFTYVIRTFLPYFTYPVDSSFILSSGSEDTIFDLGIFSFFFRAGSISLELNFHIL
nr:hypothetical protein [Tanacetum cinerariifolium]